MSRKLKMGMVGGGNDAFIGAVHRMAAFLDGQAELVAGAFSSSPEKSLASGQALFVDSSRCYASFEEMAEKEAALPKGERIDFVSIVTPNHLHFPVAKVFLEAGFHVVCDKPMTFTLAEARILRKIVQKTGRVFALTHNYSGYPMVREAREWVRKGKIGKVLKVVSEYPQGWLSEPLETTGQKQADWRTDPARAGISCCMGDIGTHAEQLARYVTGLEIESLCAELTTFVEGRLLEDDGNVLIRYKGGAKGIIYASQISNGEENGLHLRVYGTTGSLEWHQEDPNYLIVKRQGKPIETWKRGNDYLSAEAKAASRIPAGHPEAFIEAFANIYRDAFAAIRAAERGKVIKKKTYPDVDDGVYGMAFVETVVKSGKSVKKWTPFPKV
jgi:predicted dehydrogenase